MPSSWYHLVSSSLIPYSTVRRFVSTYGQSTAATEGLASGMDDCCRKTAPCEPGRFRAIRRLRQTVGTMWRRGPWGFFLLLVIGNIVLSYMVFAQFPATEWTKSTKDITMASVGPMVAKANVPLSNAEQLEARGYLVPAQQILVSPLVCGLVVAMPIKEGQRVAKGDVLARLDEAELRVEYERASATLELARNALLELERGSRPEEIAQARSDLAEAEAQLLQLEAEWKRSGQLRARHVLSEQEYELVQSRYWAMNRRVERLRLALKLTEMGPREERIAMARAQVRQAEVELIKVQKRLDGCIIRAPISGTILKKNSEEGNLVNPASFRGCYSLCELADLTNLEADLLIQERDFSRVYVGQTCTVRTEAFPDRTYQGVVARVLPMADRNKGAIPVRVQVRVPPEEDGVYLKPEMRVLVTFSNKPADEVKLASMQP